METNEEAVPKVKSVAFTVDGNHTDVVFTEFSNKLFIIITQFEKFGSLVQVTQNNVQDTPLTPSSCVFNTKVLFGKDEVEVHAASRYLTELMSESKPVLLSLGLKDYNMSTIRALGERMKDLKTR